MTGGYRVEITDPEPGASGSGTSYAYSLEARLNYHCAKNFGGFILDNRWREIPRVANKDGVGVPRPHWLPSETLGRDLLTRNEAEAHRWFFICWVESLPDVGGSLCIETRIIEHKVEWSRKETPIAVISPLDSRGDVPEDMRIKDVDK